MKGQKRIRDFGYTVGTLPPGPLNAITDIAGIRVGHVTLSSGDTQTGVTVLLPHSGDLFNDKVLAAVHVINGFGKSLGTIQLEELGTLETPIVLTNTLSIGEACSGLLDYMLHQNPEIGTQTGTVNPVVCECNDGYLNDIRARKVQPRHVLGAIAEADTEFEEGAVGAGRGMSCFKLKGGIGSASRIMPYAGRTFTLGALVLSNMGQTMDLSICGDPVGRRIDLPSEAESEAQSSADSLMTKTPDGSIIILLATDLPLAVRQLKRVCRRAVVGLSRTGSFIDNGSGDIVIAFTTANRLMHGESESIATIRMINDHHLNLPFRAAAECVEEAILNSMVTAKTTHSVDGRVRRSLREYLP